MLSSNKVSYTIPCRSREGAWIEIIADAEYTAILVCRSREGAWIEIEVVDE